MADGSFLESFPVITSDEIPDMPKTLASLALSDQTIATGEYQIAMILVNPGGDALDLSDWYNGFNGLISATTFKYNEQCDPLDTDCDGFIDLSVDPSSARLHVDDTVDITISGGTGDYSAASDDESIASVTVNGSTATVTGVNARQDSVTITITDTNTQETASVSIVVTETEPEP